MIKKKLNLITVLIIISSFIIRFWNINYDNLWFDEIISFWLSDPRKDFFQSLSNHYKNDVSSYFYHLILKFFFSLFGYKPEVSRMISGLFSFLSVLYLAHIVKLLNYRKAYNFCLFLAGFNIFLISYSQEARVYSIFFFSIVLSITYFVKSFYKQKNINIIFFILFTVLSCLLHPFGFFIICSYLIYLFLFFIKEKKLFIKINFSLGLCAIIILIYYYIHFLFIYSLQEKSFSNFWIPPIDFKFLTNLFFSSFFGSRIMGLIFFVSIILLVIKNINLFSKLNMITFFIIFIIFTYFSSILLSVNIKSILTPRYFIFLLAPLIIVVSILCYELKNEKIRKFFVYFLVVVTFLNNFTEQTFKQFYQIRSFAKPEYLKSLKYINDSEHKNYSIKVNMTNKNFNNISLAINNYLSYLSKKNKLNINYINYQSVSTLEYYWLICPLDFQKNCFSNNEIQSFEIIKNINLNRLNIRLLKRNS